MRVQEKQGHDVCQEKYKRKKQNKMKIFSQKRNSPKTKITRTMMVAYLKEKVSSQNQIGEVANQLQWGWPQHYMLQPMTNFDELSSLLLGQDPLHLPTARNTHRIPYRLSLSLILMCRTHLTVSGQIYQHFIQL